MGKGEGWIILASFFAGPTRAMRDFHYMSIIDGNPGVRER